MKLFSLLKESFNLDQSEITDDKKLSSAGEWDSMSHMFFITKLEELYNIELTGDEIANIQTVGDIKQIITSKGEEI